MTLSFREELKKRLKELSQDEEQMKQLQKSNPQMYQYIKEMFPSERRKDERNRNVRKIQNTFNL